MIATIGGEVAEYRIVPDEVEQIAAALREWSDVRPLDLVLTTGGTGLSPRDVTPEATRSVITREVPGIAEAMRLEGLKHTPRAMLSRAVAGVAGRTLIVNLPGSPKGRPRVARRRAGRPAPRTGDPPGAPDGPLAV